MEQVEQLSKLAGSPSSVGDSSVVRSKGLGEGSEVWERISKCQLPKPPSVVIELLEAVRAETSLQRPTEIISREPSLAAEILTIVNSPWFDLKREIRTINHAVTMLGVDAVCSLASAFALRDSLSEFEGSSFDYGAYWSRSVLAATAARLLASSKKDCDAEEVFLAALLQDIGMLVLVQAYPECYGELMRDARGDHLLLQETEKGRLGADHVEIGEWLAGIWNLPRVFQLAIARSRGVIDSNEEEVPTMVRCVSLSGPLAGVWENADTARACEEAQIAAGSAFGLGLDQLHLLLVAIAKGFREASEIFKVPTGRSDRIHQVLAIALEQLSLEESGDSLERDSGEPLSG